MRPLTDRFSIGRPIGQGGVGEVFEGWQHPLDRPVAIKLLKKEYTEHTAAVARFEQEARTTCLLRHPNVVTVIDVGTAEDGRHFVVMELLEGQTLGQLLERRGRLPVEEALDITWQVVRGMGAGQGVGLVHRDLKPENIFVLDSQHVKVLDFGLATLLEQGQAERGGIDLGEIDEEPTADQAVRPARLTRPGALMGTPRYMAPEQVLGWGIDHRSDLYSFGCILFEMLTGQPPFPGPRPREYMLQHRQTPPPRVEALAPEVPKALGDVVARLLEKSPSDRFPDWAALARALRRLERRAQPRGNGSAPGSALQVLPGEPYRFLNPFTASCGSIFFGRDADAALFQDLWQHVDTPAMVIVTGASGVGKTSFLSARVVPWLERTGHRVLRVRGTRRPLVQVAHQAARELGQPGVARDEDGLPMLLDALLTEHGEPIALVLDQLEEVFTTGEPQDAARLQAGLTSVLSTGDSRVRVILSMREDYLGAVLRALHPLPVDLLARTLPLRPLSAPDIRAALVGPGEPGLEVEYRPFTFEDGLADEIVDDLLADAAGEVAPRIQAVGSRLWEMVRKDPDPIVIRRHHYRERLGGARGILARMLDEAILAQAAGEQGVAKELLRALTHLPGSATSRPAPESELVHYDGDAERRRGILRQLEDRWRVVHGYADDRWPGERVYRIAHEALISRIQDYGEEGGERNRARQVFHQGLSLWLRGGQKDEDLLPDFHFEIIQRHIGDLVLRTPTERRFYEASQRQHNESWIRRQMEERQQTLRQKVQLTLVPAILLMAGFVLGQAVADWVTLRTLQVKAYSALSVPQADLTGARLRGASLPGVDLRGAHLGEADLREADLSGANLEQARLEGTRLAGADLSGANLRGATLRARRLWDTRFRGADLRHATLASSLEGADFTGAIFDASTRWPLGPPPEGALGPNGNAEGADLRGLSLQEVDMVGITAPEANLEEVDLRRAGLFMAVLDGANLNGAQLIDAHLGRASLAGADARGADFTRASAHSADLRGADLEGASFRDADLRHARFDGASLCGADFTGARVEGASWKDARTCESTRWADEGRPAEIEELAQQAP